MKNKTKTQPKAKDFDISIPGRLVPIFLKSLENTSERIMMSSIEHIIGSLIKKTKKK